MDSIYIDKNCGEERFKIMLNGKDDYINPENGEQFLGELAPFSFNPVQQSFRDFYKGGNAVIATPTGTGKTVVAFLAMFYKNGERETSPTIYLSPTRALARQVYQELKKTRLRIFLRTGESKMDIKSNFDIVVATPEAYLAARHSNSPWIEKAKLVVVDEAHMLVQNGRGIVYEEAIVHCMGDEKTLLLLSATMPDALEMAKWTKAELLIESNWRPLPLKREFVKISAPSRKNKKKIGKQVLKEFLEQNIREGIKTMIIIPSKKSGWSLLEGFESIGYQVLNQTVPYMKRDFGVKPVIAFHNADIPVEEKHEIERQFKDHQEPLSVLISTQTLAYGFNSPADDILIFVKYSPYNADNLWPTFLDLLQFEGRAGRKGHSTRGFGRVMYSTGARGTRTMEILQEKLKRGLDENLETALDKSFEVVSRGFGDTVSREMGDIELASLGILSVDPDRKKHLHYKSPDKKKVLREAFDRLLDIGMLDDVGDISPLGRLTASYMLNPERVSQFSYLAKETQDGEPDNASFWDKFTGITMLVPSAGRIPAHYPPFIPVQPGLWNAKTITGQFQETGLLQYSLGTLTTRTGLAVNEQIVKVHRQRPPAWTASMKNDIQLVLSFVRQGSNKGFWSPLTETEYQRIHRSISFGVHPYYSLLTEITNIGSIRANILAFTAIQGGIPSDVELVYTILSDEQKVLDCWPGTEAFFRAWYATQAEWLKDETGIEGEVNLDALLKTDYQTFQEAVYLIRREAETKQKTLYGTPTLAFEKNPLQSVSDAFEKQYGTGVFLFIHPKAGNQKNNFQDPYLSSSIDLLAADKDGNAVGKARVYAPGRLPPKSILEFIPHAEPFLATDTEKFMWID